MKLDPDPEKAAWLKATVLFCLAAPYLWVRMKVRRLLGRPV